jgi:hypothetical protein
MPSAHLRGVMEIWKEVYFEGLLELMLEALSRKVAGRKW